MRILTTLLLASVFTLGLTSCGSDDSTGPAEPRAISGTVIKGPVLGALVTLLAVNSDGSPGDAVAGPFTTDVDGNWSGETTASGPFYLLATGGEYTDEASNDLVDIGTGTMMSYTTSGSGVVSPYTQLLCGVVEEADESVSLAAAWQGAIAAFEQNFGFDPTSTIPSESGTTAQQSYVAALGGLSLLVDDTTALSSLTGVTLFEVILALIADIADSELDGLSLSGGTIQIGNSQVTLPAIDLTGLGELVAALNQYADSVPALADLTFEPIDLDFSDIFEPVTGGSGSLVLSGPGLSALPENTFEVVSGNSPSPEIHNWGAVTSGLEGYAIGIIDTNAGGNFFRSVLFLYSNDDAPSLTWETLLTSNGGSVTLVGNEYVLVNATLASNNGHGNLILNGRLTIAQ